MRKTCPKISALHCKRPTIIVASDRLQLVLVLVPLKQLLKALRLLLEAHLPADSLSEAVLLLLVLLAVLVALPLLVDLGSAVRGLLLDRLRASEAHPVLPPQIRSELLHLAAVLRNLPYLEVRRRRLQADSELPPRVNRQLRVSVADLDPQLRKEILNRPRLPKTIRRCNSNIFLPCLSTLVCHRKRSG